MGLRARLRAQGGWGGGFDDPQGTPVLFKKMGHRFAHLWLNLSSNLLLEFVYTHDRIQCTLSA